MGNRIAKHITNNQTNLLEKSTYYILDAQGNTLNTYDHEVTDNAVLYTLKERQIYGSSRLGIYDDSISMYIPNPDDYVNKEKGHKFYELSNHLGNVLTVISDKKIPQMGTAKILDFETPITESFDYADVCVPDKLFYETAQFSGHTYEVDAKGNTVYKIDGLPHSVQYSLDGLTPGESYTIAGRFIENNTNVAVTVRSCENSSILVNTSFKSAGDFTVRFIAPYENVSITFLSLGGVWSADDISFSGKGLGSNEICYLADIVNIADYSPFGVQLDGRTITSEKYRYGFNGMEKDDEVKGEGNSYDFGARMHDPRVARFLSIDPKFKYFSSESNYSYAGNNPILNIDVNGEFKVPIHGEITGIAMKKLTNVYKTSKLDIHTGATIVADYLGFMDDNHFDGRPDFASIDKRWNELNKEIDDVISDFGPWNADYGGTDALTFGKKLHNVQDFYAHSNYVELYIEYYKNSNDGALPDPNEIPLYDEGIKNEGFLEDYLTPRLLTGEFHVGSYIIGQDKKNTNKAGDVHHDDIAKDNREMGKIVKNKDGTETLNTFDAAVNVATRHSEKIATKLNEKLK